MKTKFFLMLAIALTIFAVTANAQPTGNLCPPGSQQTTIYRTICGVPNTEITVCYICPTDDLTLTFEIHPIKVTFPISPPVNCNWKAEVDAALSDWNLITTLCPGWSTLLPCDDFVEKNYYIAWPLCWRFYGEYSGAVTLEPCLPVECLCVGHYKYCYDVDHIKIVWVSDGIVPAPGGSGPCPPLTGDCATYSVGDLTVIWNHLPGTYSTCGHICE
jgi:hypothetical protein